MFRDVETGVRLYSFEYGWGTVVHINRGKYPLQLNFEHSIESFAYTFNGKGTRMPKNQTLFWGEIKFKVPKKPLPDIKVDTKVIVWASEEDTRKEKRYFKEFNKDGDITCFTHGTTSWTAEGAIDWKYWELVE